jgi:hypothetical protein
MGRISGEDGLQMMGDDDDEMHVFFFFCDDDDDVVIIDFDGDNDETHGIVEKDDLRITFTAFSDFFSSFVASQHLSTASTSTKSLSFCSALPSSIFLFPSACFFSSRHSSSIPITTLSRGIIIFFRNLFRISVCLLLSRKCFILFLLLLLLLTSDIDEGSKIKEWQVEGIGEADDEEQEIPISEAIVRLITLSLPREWDLLSTTLNSGDGERLLQNALAWLLSSPLTTCIDETE